MDVRGAYSADILDIFSMSLKYLKDHLMDHFRESGRRVKFKLYIMNLSSEPT